MQNECLLAEIGSFRFSLNVSFKRMQILCPFSGGNFSCAPLMYFLKTLSIGSLTFTGWYYRVHLLKSSVHIFFMNCIFPKFFLLVLIATLLGCSRSIRFAQLWLISLKQKILHRTFGLVSATMLWFNKDTLLLLRIIPNLWRVLELRWFFRTLICFTLYQNLPWFYSWIVCHTFWLKIDRFRHRSFLLYLLRLWEYLWCF